MARRDEIVQAAIELAEKEGIGALSVRRVAAATGIGATTLRHYFPTQDALAVAVVREMSAGGPADGDIFDRSRPALDRLAECLDQYLLIDETRKASLELWLQLRDAGSDDSNGSFAGLMQSAYSVLNDTVTHWLLVLANEGRIDRVDVEPATFTIVSFLDGLAMRHINGLVDDPAQLRRRLRWLLTRLLHERTS
ncbi:TetR/AcrR family transcriptional regulator [Spelaeicoccus albus]|uniref:AcrR family transcriptional regulator n=1 Tax=Spelaeicoccus albus TaxID=1280376 RepID=A0A7Z0D590_9MICO|nr:TetR family transcriptional regulator [Spelaeicoccus albus]NYI69137.1 AcrR family transcriptional regulator [Spelaeicoccus albus]